ncbi:hypothetical protein B0T09DRAFT_159581 [Sordaria sp. MPI-SDFR-AT-0083]|nr:hypothetical protein B0T09DRAFT_159581 [Sordaria sp. MPI-SDFR-AT-0083]
MWSASPALLRALRWMIARKRRSKPEPPYRTATESVYIAPSWSWVSVRPPVIFGACTPGVVRTQLKIEEMVGIPKYQDPYGALQYGALVLSGAQLFEADIGDQITGSHGPTDKQMMMKDGVSIGEVTLDSPDVSHILNPTKVSFLWTDTVVDSHGLVLREGTNPDDEYTRVGLE